MTQRPPIPCQPSPCGANAVCQVLNGHEACSCVPGYIGPPPNCRPECVINAECPPIRACIQQKCGDPCSGACGINAKCDVVRIELIYMLDEMFQRNASKFSILLEYKNPGSFFVFHFLLF